MSEWQPIETAPKDGQTVILAGGKFYCEMRNRWIEGPFTAAWDSRFTYDSWLIAGVEGGYVSVFYEGATHWMPLPTPPEE